ncbi:secondary thiamine-phosphate synthase enzyme YjbQ [Bremerella sp. P1]|uniref:secondary thiamine-phosphate synthase enzyme YjbQ n=1 Tax=Bremerella sp. P1 TaxID=3026424 RepID=UPI0023675F1F|nr:secondary thiamine-phosphate synthase enzyme YjbQ [Bremerella sp. P1]WDI40205.1 secondary thiamine-phosphate synthase enzyme YjbQ [Bremerella sp. P1]
MTWIQKEITLRARSRGFHLVTREVLDQLPELREISVGLLNIFIQHTSASLGINENADPDVRVDLEMAFSKIVHEDFPYVHTLEGPDDMPAHIKAAMIGSSLSIPITNGHLNLGTWQGIYLCEHRNRASGRRLVLTIQGERS